MLRHLIERILRSIFNLVLRFSRNPNIELASLNLKFKHEGDLSKISTQYRIRLETLQHQKDVGLDNPAYRFHRDEGFFSYFVAHADSFRRCSWLDVGAGTGAVSLYLSEILGSTNFELCDVSVAARSSFPVKQIDGTHLNHESNSFDLVFFSYVLHHAGDNTIQLLRDAHRIARRYVAVTEDPKETAEDYLWAYKHDKQGTFRGLKEWKELFSTMDFSLVYEIALDCRVHSRHFFLLAPKKDGRRSL